MPLDETPRIVRRHSETAEHAAAAAERLPWLRNKRPEPQTCKHWAQTERNTTATIVLIIAVISLAATIVPVVISAPVRLAYGIGEFVGPLAAKSLRRLDLKPHPVHVMLAVLAKCAC